MIPRRLQGWSQTAALPWPSRIGFTEEARRFSIRYQGLGEASGAEGAPPFHGPQGQWEGPQP